MFTGKKTIALIGDEWTEFISGFEVELKLKNNLTEAQKIEVNPAGKPKQITEAIVLRADKNKFIIKKP